MTCYVFTGVFGIQELHRNRSRLRLAETAAKIKGPIWLWRILLYYNGIQKTGTVLRPPDKVHISSPNPMFDHLLESSQRDDSSKLSNIGFDEEIKQVESIEVNCTHLIWSSVDVLRGKDSYTITKSLRFLVQNKTQENYHITANKKILLRTK